MGSLRVAIGPIFIFPAVVVFFLFLFFFLFFFGLFPQKNVGGQQTIRVIRGNVFHIHSLHAQWYAVSLATAASKAGKVDPALESELNQS